MTHNFFLNLMSIIFPLLCLILAFVPDDFNHYVNLIARWFYRRFNVEKSRQSQFSLNTTALRFFGVIGLLFTLAMLVLIFYTPAA
ncbi:MAG: hypothetical protein OEY11_08180 [Gammaproteobacteria bacterium]|nr:hypothetical protein [Gammaproteobacteria bacterium]